MGFQFTPQPIEQLKSRLPVALKKIWYADEDMQDRPGLHNEYVFDFESGLRLIISRDKFPGFPDIVIHVSGSYPQKGLKVTTIGIQETLNSIGLKGVITHIGHSPRKVGHWILKLVN